MIPNNTKPVAECEHLKNFEAVLRKEIDGIGRCTVLLADMSGRIVAKYDGEDCGCDLNALAALAASNCAATDILANLVGEEEFHLYLLRGRNRNVHFSKVGGRFLLIALFGGEISVGLLRMKIEELARKFGTALETVRDMFLLTPFPLGVSA
jgi:predicted regulator of Ras-like GTPase activity (Roadblock/LC7/MglB family)